MIRKGKTIRAFALIASVFFMASCVVIPSKSDRDASKSHTNSTSSSEIPAISSSKGEEEKDPRKTKLSYTTKDYANHNVAGADYCPTVGEVKLLVIPVWFTDSGDSYIYGNHKKDVRNDIQTAYFGTKEETGWNSVKSYYETLSQGRLTLNGVVSDWWECGISSAVAGASQNATQTLLDGAINWYFSLPNAEERSSFDSDGNGYLDGVMLIYGAPDYAALANDWAHRRDYDQYSNLWAYCSWDTTNAPSVTEPTANVFFWASYDFMYGSNTANNRTGNYTYYGGDTTNCSLDTHSFIHEMGHVFGIEDYYDYSQQYNIAGGFSMQDENVGSHDPFSALICGWVDPIIPTKEETITIRPFQNEGHDLILLSNAWNGDNSPYDEYILVELYTPTGLNKFDCDRAYRNYYPQGPSGTGIRVWHVDNRLIRARSQTATGQVIWNNNPVTDPTLENVYWMMSNTSYDSSDPSIYASYGSQLGTSYADYNLLQLIRNDTKATYHQSFNDHIDNNDLFQDGSLFNMTRYSKQFVNGNELNCKDYLGWQFYVSISGEGENAVATIELQKYN